MCGIAGAVTSDDMTTLRATVERAISRQHHRGPDDSGVWSGNGAVLGHNRLSIIDLGGGHQPMHDESGRYTIVFNGEIYNFRELRKNLEADGQRFKSHSDTEVLLRLYMRHGTDCLRQLNGMFAFAVWDNVERTLFLARDRLGVKPLYYWISGHELRFASEIDALAHGVAGLDTDNDALLDYLTFLYVPSPRTIYRQIQKLPPAHYLFWKNGSARLERYWNPSRIQPDRSLSEAGWIERLQPLFTDAVRARLVSDVPLGAFLSGGVDSAAVVSEMAGLMTEPVKTFTIGFVGDDASELPFARAMAQHCRTDHVEHLVAPPDIPDLLNLICRHFGEPFADSSAVPTMLVSALARERVTVALSGDGGDELFAGYRSYHYYERLNALEARLGPIAGMIGAIGRNIPVTLAQRVPLAGKARSFLAKMGQPLSKQWSISRSILSRGSAAGVLGPALRERFNARSWNTHLGPYFEAVGDLDVVNQLTRVDIQTYLPDDLLVKVDRMSMAKSLEVRSPFLDYRLVEMALAVPMEMKRRDGQGKWILRRMLDGKVPEDTLWRRKQGFTMPLERWFRTDLNRFAHDLLLGSKSLCDMIDKKGVAAMLKEHANQRVDHGSLIWALIVLETWLRQRAEGVRS